MCQLQEKSCERTFKCRKTKQNRLMLLSNCAVCGKKKSTFIKNKELNIFKMIHSKWIKSLTNFYWVETNLCQNCIWNNQGLLIVLADHLSNIVKEFKQIKWTGNLKQLYKNELHKPCFAQDAVIIFQMISLKWIKS